MIRVAVLVAVALLSAGPKKKTKKAGPKEVESVLAGATVGAPLEALQKVHPWLHQHTRSNGALQWDACDHKESVRFVFDEELFLKGKLAAVRMSKVEGILCSHDDKLLPSLKLAAKTPRGVKLGADEKTIVKAYGPAAESEEDAAVGAKYLRYKRVLEATSEQPAMRQVLIFELRHAKLHGVQLLLEPST